MAPNTTTVLLRMAPLLLTTSLILSLSVATAPDASSTASLLPKGTEPSLSRSDHHGAASSAYVTTTTTNRLSGSQHYPQRRSLLRRGSRALFCLFDWDCEDGEEGWIGDFEFPCLGVFVDCAKVQNNSTNSGNTTKPAPTPAPVSVNYTLCNNRTDGIFGGRPLFGECGVLTEFVDGLFNVTDTDGDGEADGITIGNPLEADKYVSDEDLFLSLFPEGSLLWEIFNDEDDEEFVESVLGSYREITDLFNNGYVDEWVQSVTFTNNTCRPSTTTNSTNTTVPITPAVVEPVCLNLMGGEGFWVCRTLYDPFDGQASNQSVCIDKGQFLARNDKCGCCGNACPKPCPCKCNLEGGINNGVIVQYYLFDTDIPFGNRCVSPAFATAITARYGQNIDCLLECPVPKNSTATRA